MLGDDSKIQAHSPIETVRLAPMRGDVLSSINHLLMLMTAHHFEVDASLETLRWQNTG